MHAQPFNQEQVRQILGSPEKTEDVLSLLSAYEGKIVIAGQEWNTLSEAVSETSKRCTLNAEQERMVRTLLRGEPLEEQASVTRLSYTTGIHPDELAFVRTILKDEPQFKEESVAARRESILGRIFRALEKGGYEPAWGDVEEVLERNCELSLSSQYDDLRKMVLTETALTLRHELDGAAAKRYAFIEEILSKRANSPFLMSLARKFTPGCVERRARIEDGGQSSIIDEESHILRQPVVTQFKVEEDSFGRPRIGSTVIYLSDRQDAELYTHIAHELIELGIMQHFFKADAKKDAPLVFASQFLAETKITDVLVWTLQHKTLKAVLSKEENITVLDRAFVVSFSLQKKIAAFERVVGADHPLACEMRLYQNVFSQVLRGENPMDYLAATKEVDERNPAEQHRYGEFLLRFYGLYLGKLSGYAPEKGLMLVDPQILAG